MIDAASLRRKTLPQGERKVKVQGAADQVKDFSMQLLIDKQRGEEGGERRGRDGGPPTPIVCNIVYICLAF